jgi:hypothetical protein
VRAPASRDRTLSPGTDGRETRVQVLHVADCPLLEQLQRRVHTSIARAGLDVPVETIEGPYPSPTLLVNGAEVTGQPTSATRSGGSHR